ncbi:MAG TPA: hypothetical protein VIA02_04605 [Candidatus Limnocylindria bacterium]
MAGGSLDLGMGLLALAGLAVFLPMFGAARRALSPAERWLVERRLLLGIFFRELLGRG